MPDRNFPTLAFHKSGKPRKWVRLILFRKSRRVRPAMRRIVYKKNGEIRPIFLPWYAEWRSKAKRGLPGGLTTAAAAVVEAPTSDVRPAPIEPDDLRPQEKVLRDLRPVRDALPYWKILDPMPDLADETQLANALRLGLDRSGLILSVTHDDYRRIVGGVQLCVQYEEQFSGSYGYNYLCLFPFQPLPLLAEPDTDPDPAMHVVLDGRTIGAARMSTIHSVIGRLAPSRPVHVVIHQLLGHSAERISALVKLTGRPSLFWIHDYFSMCPNFTLRRNMLDFCYAPPLSSNSCGICAFGEERAKHLERMQRFFETTEIVVLSPSRYSADFWKQRSGLPAQSVRIVPHMTLAQTPRMETSENEMDTTIVIAYLGAPIPHKGWPVFRRLIERFGRSAQFRFVVLSQFRPEQGEDDWIEVAVSTASPDAMVRAVRDSGADLAILWPAWPETFSFTCFEALAGSAFVVTNEVSGNVAAAVDESGRGVILQDEDALMDFMANGAAQALAARRRDLAQQAEVAQQVSAISLSLIPRIG